jgi:hypothetical protein
MNDPVFRPEPYWQPPPPVTPCPLMGEAYVDDPAYDMCICGRRHITIECWGSGGRDGT